MTVLVSIEYYDGVPTSSSLGVLAAGKNLAGSLGCDLAAVVIGAGAAAVGSGLGAYGATRVLAVEDARCSDPVAGPRVDALCAAVDATGARVLLASASVLAAEVAGAVAARYGVGVNADGVGIEVRDGRIVHIRGALDDSQYVASGWKASSTFEGVALFRAGSFQPATANGGSAQVENLDVPDSGRRTARFVGHEQPADTGGVDITQADVLVAAGRGLGGPDHFDIVESLAKSMGGEVATTRAVVDAGWYDYSTQVGQTGKTVSPKLYIAVGISGAIQHKVGMQNSGTIIAINKDPNAPIFEFADLGVVGDLFEVVPKLEEKLKARKGG